MRSVFYLDYVYFFHWHFNLLSRWLYILISEYKELCRVFSYNKLIQSINIDWCKWYIQNNFFILAKPIILYCSKSKSILHNTTTFDIYLYFMLTEAISYFFSEIDIFLFHIILVTLLKGQCEAFLKGNNIRKEGVL